MPEQIERPTNPAGTCQLPADEQSTVQADQHSIQEQRETAYQTQQQQVIQNQKKSAVEWHQLIGAARLMWSKVSEAELLASKGEEQNLTNIVSARYVLSHNTANTQVKKFLATQVIAGWFHPAR